MENIVLFFTGRAAGTAGCAAYQYRRAKGDQRFRQMRAHMSDPTENVVNMKKPHGS
jgi:hypothetical protein